MAQGGQDDEGFTLIELLVVIVILGVLAGIAIPTFLNQREKGYKSQAISDMRNAAIAIESYATDFGGDYSGMNGADENTPLLQDQGFNNTNWVSVDVVADLMGYCITAVNSQVPGQQFVLRSDSGVLSIEALGLASC